ncbi:hypothetical protein [Streptomyces sp. NPDC007074]|uniref:hypothetical protein n=1 Tax=unclassified Streptomyces TaxID=2593676 RepID=UPI0033F95994
MAIWLACLWGLLGAGLVEVRALWAAIQPFRVPKWPWRDSRGRPQKAGYAIAVVCRFGMAAGLDAVYAAAHQIVGPLGAVTMGITAPLVIQQMAVRNEPASTDASRIAASTTRRPLPENDTDTDVLTARSGGPGTRGDTDVR